MERKSKKEEYLKEVSRLCPYVTNYEFVNTIGGVKLRLFARDNMIMSDFFGDCSRYYDLNADVNTYVIDCLKDTSVINMIVRDWKLKLLS